MKSEKLQDSLHDMACADRLDNSTTPLANRHQVSERACCGAHSAPCADDDREQVRSANIQYEDVCWQLRPGARSQHQRAK